MIMHRSWSRRLAALIAVPILGVAVAAQGASAAPASPLPFADQAAKAGLTSDQAKELQSRVDAYLVKTHGVQTAANRIEYQKAVLTLTLPGETIARDITAPRSTLLGSTCSYYWVCVWHDRNFSGDRIDMYYCNTWVGIPWFAFDGSWDNNQTPGTKMGVKPVGNYSPWFSWPAHWTDAYGVRWDNIAAMSAC